MKLICLSLNVEFGFSNKIQNLKCFSSFGCCFYGTVVIDAQTISVGTELS